MAEGEDLHLSLFSDINAALAPNLDRQVNKVNINYNVYVNEQNNTTNIKRSSIDSLVVSEGSSRRSSSYSPAASTSSPIEEQSFNLEMIDGEDPDDVTWLAPKIVLFKNRRISAQRNSKVYKGRQELLDGHYRDVAIKLIQYNKKNMREIMTLMKLNHPNVVHIYDAGQHRGLEHSIYIVMELCSMNLDEYVTKNPTNPGKAWQFFNQIVSAVDFMHKENIAHRDIKPSNILISKCGNFIKFSDFGISKELLDSGKSATTTSNGAGTEGYKPPEVYKANYKISLSSDIFSLGLVSAYLLSHGKHPFGDDPLDWSYNIRKNKKFDLTQISSAIPKKELLTDLIKQMLQRAPSGRPTAKDIIHNAVFSELTPNDSNINNADQEKKRTDDDDVTIKNPAIVLVDKDSKHLQYVNLRDKSIMTKQEYPDDVNSFYIAPVGRYVYALEWCDAGLKRRSMYRLECTNASATWEEMCQWPDGHGRSFPPVVASRDALYLVGGGGLRPRKTVSKYDPSINRWEKLDDKPTSTARSSLFCNDEFLYCIEGDTGLLGLSSSTRVERMDLKSSKWTKIADMNRQKRRYIAECRGRIYDFYDEFDKLSAESWNPKTEQWSKIKLHLPDFIGSKISGFGSWSSTKALTVDHKLYFIGGKGISAYDVEKNEFSIVTSYSSMDIVSAAVVSLIAHEG